MNAKLLGALAAVAACCVIIILLLGGSVTQLIEAVASGPDRGIPGHTETEKGIHFFNDDVNTDSDANNNYNFGISAYEDVVNGNYSKSYEELLDRLNYTGEDDSKGCDPNLMAAIAYAMDLNRGTNILKESHDKSLRLGERPNVAAERLLKSEKDRQEVYDALKAQFESAEVSIEELGAYSSQMYQLPTGTFFNDRPALTVKNTQHEGGHVLIFKWEDGTVLKLRLECGYQPVDTLEWYPPHDDDTPPPETTPVVTTLEPKHINEAPPVQDDPDIGGEVRYDDIDDRLTPEPNIEELPSTYIAPERPVVTEGPTIQTEAVKPVTQEPEYVPPVVEQTVIHEEKIYVQAPQQHEDLPPLEDVNEEAPIANGVDEEVQVGTVPADVLSRFG